MGEGTRHVRPDRRSERGNVIVIAGYDASPIDGTDGLLNQMTKAVLERALQAEMTHHLGYERDDPAGHAATSFAGAVILSALARRWTIAVAFLAVAIAFSRSYVGDHYFGDVLGAGEAWR